MNKKYAIIVGIVIIILIIGGVLLWKDKKVNSTVSTIATKPTREPLPKEATIILNKDGFTPKKVTIKVGTAVRWKNESGTQETVNSDNYPTNQLHKELNFGVFNNGSTVVHTFTKPGTYGFHNQFHPEEKGNVNVIK